MAAPKPMSIDQLPHPLPTVLKRVLDEYQVDSAMEAINGYDTPTRSGCIAALLDCVVVATDDVIKKTIIDGVIFPHNLNKLNHDIWKKIDQGGHMVMSVAGGFHYTIGLTNTHGCEIFLTPYLGDLGHELINELANWVKAGKTAEIMESEVASVADNSLRCRLVPADAPQDIIKENFARLSTWTRQPTNTIYLVELGDVNNLLPGESGFTPNNVSKVQ